MPTNQTSTTSDKTTETTTQRSPQTYGGGQYGTGDLASALLAVMTGQTQTIKGLNQARQDAVAQQMQAQEAQLAAQKIAAANAGEAARQKAEITYAQNALLEQHQRDFGMNPADLNNEIKRSLALRNTLQPELEAARAAYDKANSVGLLDNPIGYLFAQLKLPQLAAKNNAIADSIARADHNIAQRTALLNGVKQTVSANNADAIRRHELLQAEATARVAEAGLHAAEAANRGALANARMQDIQIANMVGDNQRQTLMGVATLKDQEEARVLRREQMELTRMQRAEILNKKQLEADEEARLNANLKLVSDGMGLSEPMTVNTLMRLPANQRASWINAASALRYGDDLLSAIQFFKPNASRNGMAMTGASKIYDTAAELEKAAASKEGEATIAYRTQNMGKTPKREEAVALGFQLYQQTVEDAAMGPKSASDLSSNKWDKEFNPYRVPMLAFNGAVNTDPKLASLRSNLVTKTVNDLAKITGATGMNLTAAQQQQVIGSIREQVRSGKLSAAQAAAHISSYFAAGSDWNMRSTGYTQFGLMPPSAYMFTLEGEFLGPDRKKLNLMNPAELERALELDKVKAFSLRGLETGLEVVMPLRRAADLFAPTSKGPAD